MDAPNYRFVSDATRYRYYISQGLVKGRRGNAPLGRRVPAGDLEGLVEERLRSFLQNGSEILAALEPAVGVTREDDDSATGTDLVTQAAALAQAWPELPPSERRRILLALIQRVDLMPQSLEIRFLPDQLAQVLGGTPQTNATSLLAQHATRHERPKENAEQAERSIVWSIPARLKRTGIEKRLVIDGADAGARRKPDHSLARLLAQAQRFQALLLRGGDKTIGQLAKEACVSRSYFTRIVRLSFVAPEITKAILRNRHPLELSAKRLANEIRLPISWERQRTLLGIG